MSDSPARSTEDLLEGFYVDWLEAQESRPELAPATWVREHAPDEYQTALLQLISACEDALPTPKDLRAGQVIAKRFTLIEEVGSGGFGWVWRASDKLGAEVALKILRNDQLLNCDGQKYFDREARNLAAIEHPDVVSVHAVGRDAEYLYLAMEFVDGSPLSALLDQTRRPSAVGSPVAALLAQEWQLGTPRGDRVAVRLMLRLCRAVRAIHELEIFHRDLKPANVLLDRSGAPKIADFGLSKLVSGVSEAEASGLIGTLEYLSPQELRARVRMDPAHADLWALAAMLYELTTLRRPYGEGSAADIRARAERGEIVDPQQHRPQMDRALTAICRHALTDPGYDSVADFEADLQRFERGERASVQRRPKVWRWILALLAVVALLVFTLS